MKMRKISFIAALLSVFYTELRCIGTEIVSDKVSVKNPNIEEIPEPIGYMMIDLETLRGTNGVSFAFGINDHGQVIGMSTIGITRGSFAVTHAFLYENGLMKDLGTLRLADGDSAAYGINNKSQIVGTSDSRAFLYMNGSMQDLGVSAAVKGDGGPSSATGINDRGQIIGSFLFGYQLGTAVRHPFLYDLYNEKDPLRDLGILGTWWKRGSASGINYYGQVVGYVYPVFTTEESRAFLYENGSMRDLGSFGGRHSYARGINDKGQIVGYSQKSTNYHAFLYSKGEMKDLGTLGGDRSWALGINNSGQVVGRSTVSGPLSWIDRAFLYSDGVMYDLNELVTPRPTGRVLDEAYAINNAGQIVGVSVTSSARNYWRAFLLNPLPVGLKKSIDTEPSRPTYSAFPEKLSGEDGLVVVTHGWQPAWKPVDIEWVAEMTNRIVRYLADSGRENWQVHAHRWVEKANIAIKEGGPQTALRNAKSEGVNLGNGIAAQKWTHIHLIGHSAGAGLIQSACEAIKVASPTTKVHLTFLDAFAGLASGERENYGKGADWADSYFARDADTGSGVMSVTEGVLPNAHNVDVTFLDETKRPITVVYSTASGDVSRTCFETVSSHEWPHEFYARTIPPDSLIGSAGFGFALSKEAGTWDSLPSLYPAGNNPARVLGSGELSCLPEQSRLTVSAVAKPSFTVRETLRSETGSVLIHGTDGFSLTTGSPAWLAAPVLITNRANLISFEARFGSAAGAEGLLSVYWDTNLLGSIDERAALQGFRAYSFPISELAERKIGMLGFRLDSFSTIASSATVTNVSVGFAGMKELFTLSAFLRADDLSELVLSGPKGFNYTVESSTNLARWEALGVLVNTNGVVRFPVSAAHASTRFYRAVVQ